VTIVRSPLRAGLLAPAKAALIALIAIASFGGCFVSFDGYQLAQSSAAGELTLGGSAGRSGSSNGAAGRASGGDAGATPLGDGGVSDDPAAGKSSVGQIAVEGGNGGRSVGAAGGGSGGSAAGSSGSTGSGGSTAGSGGTIGSGGSKAGGGTNGSAGSAGSNNAGAGGGGQYVCPTVHGRIAVAIPRPSSPGIYCIDRAEVKNAEYQAFLDAAVGSSGQSSACSFNTSFAPDTTGGCNQYDPVGKANVPVACVDWCDAAAYCKWEGKRLCGRVDGSGSNPPASFADASKSAWYRACSHAGDFDLPYGNVYSGEKCIGLDNTAIHPVAVPHTDCEGGYSGLYDMSGNVAEWEDSCAADASASDQCLVRGGSYLETNQSVVGAPSLLCNSNVHGSAIAATKARSTRDKEIGFRCCGEPVLSP